MAEYEAYKDSGAVWIGKIPAEWTVTRLKNHLRRTDARNPGGVQVLSLYRELGIVPKDSRDDNHNVTSEDTSNYKYVQPGDFVVNKMKAWQGSVAVSDYEGIVSPAYYVYKFLDNSFHKRYFHYLIRSCYKEEFMSLSAGIRIGQWDLSSQDLDNVPVLIPSMTEQTAIAEYLDRETERIDAIIAEAKASIEEYKAWKASIIYEAVTKGLDPNVEMKDSGITWIGRMPASWKTMRIKDLGDARNGLTYSPEEQVDEGKGILVLRSSNVQGGKLVFTDNVYIGSEIPSELMLQQGDILICSRNGSRKLIGKNAYIEEDNKYSFGAFMMALRSKIRNKKYVYWLLNSGVFGYYLPMFFTSTINQLTRENFRNMVVPYCDDEFVQKRIVEYLDTKVAQIDSVIEDKERLIDDMEHYKKSLIFEVVTGKRKVV